MIRADGTIELESPQIIITPQFSREDFLVSPLFLVTKPWNQNKPYSRYVFDSILAYRDEPFGGSICFKSGQLYDFNIASTRSEFTSEELRHVFHKKLLETMFERPPDEKFGWPNSGDEMGVTYNFHWGNVSAGLDIKTGYADIYIRYAAADLK